MNNSNRTNGKIEITKALIGCVGGIIVAVIGGAFLLISTGVIQIGDTNNDERENSGRVSPGTRHDIDDIFESGNWFCLEDYPNGIGVRNLLNEVRIESPWEAADKFGERYNFGQIVPSDGPATFWLQESLSRGECP